MDGSSKDNNKLASAFRKINIHLKWLLGSVSMLVVAALLMTNATSASMIGGHLVPIYEPAHKGDLTGHVVAIDPGHGGYDGGAKAVNGGDAEKVYNLAISLALRDELLRRGATVVMTRSDDYSLNDPSPNMRKKRQDMERRAEVVLGSGAELLLSIHQNEYRKASQRGPQVFYRKDCAAGLTLATLIQTGMNDALLPDSRRRANVGDFYITSLGIPSVLIECGFLSNADEARLLAESGYQERIAVAIADSICQWFNLDDRPEAAERELR